MCNRVHITAKRANRCIVVLHIVRYLLTRRWQSSDVEAHYYYYYYYY